MSDRRIWVGCLAAHNNGQLHGDWIDLEGKDADDVHEAIQKILATSPQPNAEEWHIADYEGFGNITIDRYHDIEKVVQIVKLLEEHGEAFGLLLGYHNDIEHAKKVMEEGYRGEYDSAADYAEQFTEETSDIPEHLKFYIDYEKMAHDWELNGDILTLEGDGGKVHIFDGHI